MTQKKTIGIQQSEITFGMKNTPRITILCCLLLLVGSLSAQSLQQKVTLRYSDEKLGTVLQAISDTYQVQFTYSSHYIPVQQAVSIHVVNQPLSAALDALFAPTGVVYANIGGQIALKMGNQTKPQEQLTQINTLPKAIKQTSPVHPPSRHELWLREQMQRDREATLARIERPQMRELSGGPQRLTQIDRYELAPIATDEAEESRMAQVSILPFVGTNAWRSAELTNKVSLNVLWGVNGGVEGIEVGGLFNHITNNVHGVQVAGFGNTVGGNTIGTQVSGLFNINRGAVQGVQAAGLFNITGETDAVQAAGAFNITKADFAGVQAAGLFNVSRGKADGVQISSLFNVAQGKTRSQLSGLFNVAHDVEINQISALFNAGKNVKGLQIGLINIADSTSGVPIGLLNFIKKGYNRVEFAAGDALFANVGLKLGARSFYNIFHFGARWDDVQTSPDGIDPVTHERLLTWGLGYGVGTTVGFSPRTLLNVELVSIHVNEQEEWTRALNLLNQLRLTVDVRTGRHTSLFGGPTANVMVSRLQRADSNVVGSAIAPYTWFDEVGSTGANVQMWLGFNAGIRF